MKKKSEKILVTITWAVNLPCVSKQQLVNNDVKLGGMSTKVPSQL